jgi:hypothetical protein
VLSEQVILDWEEGPAVLAGLADDEIAHVVASIAEDGLLVALLAFNIRFVGKWRDDAPYGDGRVLFADGSARVVQSVHL